VRTLVVHPRMSVLGGAERVAIHSAKALLDRGDEVYFLSEDFDVGHVEDFYGCEGFFNKVTRISYPSFKPRTRKALLYRMIIYYRRQQGLALAKLRLRPDIILSTQDIPYVPSTEAPTIQYLYYPEYFTHLGLGSGSWSWRFYYWPASRYYRHKLSNIDKLLSVSDYSRGRIKRVWGRDATTLYPPCAVDEYASQRSERENLILTVGRIGPEKGHHTFLEIARNLPQLRFVIIGSVSRDKTGYYEELMRNLPQNCEIVLAPLMKSKELLQRAKVYIHCARDEQFGITIVEAMAAGLVPVVHDSGGPRELVVDTAGFRWTDTAEAVRQVERLVGDESLRTSMAETARLRANLFSSHAFETRIAEIVGNYAN